MRCTIRVSATCAPICRTGFSAVMGSWKIIPILRPRNWHIFRSDRPKRLSVPLSRTEPCALHPWGNRPIIASAVIDLPDPDSPTKAVIRCAASVNDRSETNAPPSWVIVRFFSSRRGEAVISGRAPVLGQGDRAAHPPPSSSQEPRP